MKRLVTLSSLVTALVLVSAPSQAQVTTDPGTGMAPAPMGTAATTSPSLGRGLGIGAEQMLFGPGGIAIAFDGGQFHIDGLVGISDTGEGQKTDFSVGGRFWWHLHSTANADLSIGGGVGFLQIGGAENDDDGGLTVVSIEAGSQIRAFVAQNVAVTGSAGLALRTNDADGFIVGGHLLGSLGVIYFFQ